LYRTDFEVLIGTQTSAEEEKRRVGTSRTTPTTRKRWPSTSIVLPIAGRPSKNRPREASLITATKRAPLSSSAVNGPPSRNSNSRIRQNSPSVRRSFDSIFLPPTYETAVCGEATIEILSTAGSAESGRT
jgi:hypothetical protein